VRNVIDATVQALGYTLLTSAAVWAIFAYVP
jgi:hypothetical protein